METTKQVGKAERSACLKDSLVSAKPATPLTDAALLAACTHFLTLVDGVRAPYTKRNLSPVIARMRAAVEGGGWQTYKDHAEELERENTALRNALQTFLDASDRFVKDTGLQHGDLITDAAELARDILKKVKA